MFKSKGNEGKRMLIKSNDTIGFMFLLSFQVPASVAFDTQKLVFRYTLLRLLTLSMQSPSPYCI